MNNDKQKHCKTFEIGDGMKSICVSDRYFAELEEDECTLLLYNPETNNIWIRITVLTFEPKDNIETKIFENNINLAKKQSEAVEIISDKSYLFEFEQSEEDGDQIITYHYDIDYKNHKILLSVTTYLENATTNDFKSVLAEIPEYISSIQEISLDKQNFFNLTYDDYHIINKRCSEILEITDELDNFHEKGKTLKAIQKFLDEEKFSAEKTFELQSLGLVFGDYIRFNYPDFQWAILHDQDGRYFCLNYADRTITFFPQTMISKRVENGEKFLVESLLKGILKAAKEIVENE